MVIRNVLSIYSGTHIMLCNMHRNMAIYVQLNVYKSIYKHVDLSTFLGPFVMFLFKSLTFIVQKLYTALYTGCG